MWADQPFETLWVPDFPQNHRELGEHFGVEFGVQNKESSDLTHIVEQVDN